MKLFFVGLLLIAFNAFAVEPLQITHARFFYSNTLRDGRIFGTMDIVGVLDRQSPEGPYTREYEGTLQYRAFGTSDWTEVGITGDISRSRSGVNYRRLNALLPATVVEFRVCRPDEGCSAPYGFRYLPLFDYVYGDAAVSPFKKTLRFEIQNVQAGGLRFAIGRLHEGIADMDYTGLIHASIVSCTPRVPGYDESVCEVAIPSEIFMQPGTYDLTAYTNAGASQNRLTFKVNSVMKILSTIPERIKLHIQTTLMFNFAGGVLRPDAIDVELRSGPCRLQHLPVAETNKDVIAVRIPPPCMPKTGSGEMIFDVSTVEGKQTVKVPYEF